MRFYKNCLPDRNTYWIGGCLYLARHKDGKFAFWIDVGLRYVLFGVFIWTVSLTFLEREGETP